jgi:hypothetical protein
MTTPEFGEKVTLFMKSLVVVVLIFGVATAIPYPGLPKQYTAVGNMITSNQMESQTQSKIERND